MEFILEQGAATDARLERITEKLEKLAAKTDALSAVAEDREQVLQVHTKWLTALTRSQENLTQSLQETRDAMDAGFAEQREAQKSTQENLNILIRTVQQMIHRPSTQ